MQRYRTIEIDLEVHKAIENERKSFSDTPNDVLRQVFVLGRGKSMAPGPKPPDPDGRAWTGKGVTLRHGTSCRFEYNGRRHVGRIDNAEWLVDGKRYKSPSAAACGAARTRRGKRPSLNGWTYWEVKRPQDKAWIRIDTLKPKVVPLDLSDF
jgi:hypothetical protein